MSSTTPWSTSPQSTFVLHSPQAPARQLLSSAYPARSNAPSTVSPASVATSLPVGDNRIVDVMWISSKDVSSGGEGSASDEPDRRERSMRSGDQSDHRRGKRRSGDRSRPFETDQKTGMIESRSTSLTSWPEMPDLGDRRERDVVDVEHALQVEDRLAPVLPLGVDVGDVESGIASDGFAAPLHVDEVRRQVPEVGGRFVQDGGQEQVAGADLFGDEFALGHVEVSDSRAPSALMQIAMWRPSSRPMLVNASWNTGSRAPSAIWWKIVAAAISPIRNDENSTASAVLRHRLLVALPVPATVEVEPLRHCAVRVHPIRSWARR